MAKTNYSSEWAWPVCERGYIVGCQQQEGMSPSAPGDPFQTSYVGSEEPCTHMKQEEFGEAEFNSLNWHLALVARLLLPLRKVPWDFRGAARASLQALHPTASLHSSFLAWREDWLSYSAPSFLSGKWSCHVSLWNFWVQLVTWEVCNLKQWIDTSQKFWIKSSWGLNLRLIAMHNGCQHEITNPPTFKIPYKWWSPQILPGQHFQEEKKLISKNKLTRHIHHGSLSPVSAQRPSLLWSKSVAVSWKCSAVFHGLFDYVYLHIIQTGVLIPKIKCSLW